MKRKIISVLLTLVLVLSLSLITAVPAAAATAELELGIKAPGAIAEWSTAEVDVGTYSVHLKTGTTGDGNEGRIVIDAASVGITTLSDITSIAWSVYTVAGIPPHVDIYLDVDEDGVVDLEDVLSAEMAYNNPFWSPVRDEGAGTGPTLWFDGDHVNDSYDAWFQTFEATEGDGYGAINNDTLLWVTKMGGGYGTAPSGTLAQWKAGEVNNDPDGEWPGGVTLDSSAPVVKLEIEVDRWIQNSEAYIDDLTINGVTYDVEWTHVSPIQVDDDKVQYPTAPFHTIQDAIAAATAGDTINVYPGTYAEELKINKASLTLTGVTAAGVINRTLLTAGAGATAPIITYGVAHMIAIDADGVTFQGFNIDTTDASAVRAIHFRSQGAALTDNTTIQYNTFDGASRAINVSDDRTVTDLTVTYNKFTCTSGEGNWFVVDSGAGISAVTQTSNVLSYNIVTGFMTANLELGDDNIYDITWSNNTLSYSIWLHERESGTTGGLFGDLVVTNNTFAGAPSTSAFEILATVEDADWEGGSFTRDDVTVNYNDFSGYVDGDAKTVYITNAPTDPLNAEYNWWGDVAGPNHDRNPYDATRDVATAADVGDNVDYIPWMIHTDLASGWNIYSTPIASGTSTNTITEALDLWTSDSAKVTGAYYFSGSSQSWVMATSLTPLVPVYLNMSAAATIDVLMSTSYNPPPSMTMYQGWNLVGPAELYSMDVDNALGSAYWASGAANLVGYSQVLSPGINQTAVWTFLRPGAMYSGDTSLPDVLPTEGYWVYMVNQGSLGGFTYTPITLLP